MKNILLAFLLIVLISCGKDDPQPSATVVGAWHIQLTDKDLSVDGSSYVDYLTAHGSSADDAADADAALKQSLPLPGFYTDMVFNADGTWTGTDPSLTAPATGKWTLTSDQSRFTLTDNAHPSNQFVARVTKLTDAEFWLITSPNVDLPQGSVPTNFTYSVTIKCVVKKTV